MNEYLMQYIELQKQFRETDDPTVGNLADVLRQSTVWYFWWD